MNQRDGCLPSRRLGGHQRDYGHRTQHKHKALSAPEEIAGHQESVQLLLLLNTPGRKGSGMEDGVRMKMK